MTDHPITPRGTLRVREPDDVPPQDGSSETLGWVVASLVLLALLVVITRTQGL